MRPPAVPATSAENARGALLMTVSMASFSCNDAFMKLALGHLSLFQAMCVRGLMTSALLLALAGTTGALRHRLSAEDRPLVALRIACEVGGTLTFLNALQAMPLANATAILQMLPLTVTLAAALALGEPVGWRRWSAIAVGFVGVGVMLRPDASGFDRHALWALAAVCFVTLRDLTTRRLSRGAPSVFLALGTALGVTLTGGVGAAFGPWRPISSEVLAMLGAGSLCLTAGYLTGVMAMRVGEVGFVSPFRYSVLVFALALGWAVFGDAPAATMLAGAAIVVATGLYTLYRERVVARARRAR